jgi:hypothetical protein
MPIPTDEEVAEIEARARNGYRTVMGGHEQEVRRALSDLVFLLVDVRNCLAALLETMEASK